MSDLPFPSSKSASSALSEASAAIASDLPLLMFGSGDVAPEKVDQDSVALLSELTANYISDLVSAAVDSHDIFTDGMGVAPPPSKRARYAGKRKTHGGDGASDDAKDDGPGVVGVDLGTFGYKPKVSSAIDTQCFIFPICHDATQYGRVMEVQQARRQIAPLMLDQVMMDMVKEEAGEGAEFPAGDMLPLHK
mmetsp:Transcript_14581/g.21523  ORF Transcript_14581/g.21523 Transcript_14581/m.21523 type:complete len:192 (+) Transcript_14581:342-917(+)|eukprot:CAMPEP_0195508668 /NCGR_PEP_ID=MMETSP0794_2-20130614/1817_1 /TAXON_ID=515487 /ORGANISM="Stephanopyxis turris, Strain CCMP 815" /LENGTH=191 /DNA_ID=CAMNT_0040635689 /DNA_START=341 /DNA_END=916 /DNA_ORIENTATION=+